MAYNPGGQPPFNPQAPFGAPPPPPPKAGMSTGVKVAIFGCIGLVFLGAIIAIVAVVIGVSLAPKNSNTTSSSSNTSNTSSSPSTKNDSSTKPDNSSTTAPKSGPTVVSIDLATDSNGQPGDTVQSFSPTDNPMHFVIKLSEASKGTKVKVVLKAVDVDSGDKDTTVGSLDYETKSLENRVNAQFELPRDWPTGQWRLEVFVNGALDKTRDFRVVG